MFAGRSGRPFRPSLELGRADTDRAGAVLMAGKGIRATADCSVESLKDPGGGGAQSDEHNDGSSNKQGQKTLGVVMSIFSSAVGKTGANCGVPGVVCVTAEEKWNQSLKLLYGMAPSTQLVPLQNPVQVAISCHLSRITSPELHK